jgi:hypothetical protein
MASEIFNGSLIITRLPGLPQPELPPVGNSYIYFDLASGKAKISENGGSYVDLVGGGGSDPNARVFRWDTATSWATIYAAIIAHGGTGIVMVEPDVTPRVMTAGVANLDDVFFFGEPTSPDTSVAIDMNDGVVLGPGGGLRSKDVLWRSLCVATRIVSSGQPCSFVFDGGGLIGWADPAATNPIRLDPGGNKIRLTNSATLTGAGLPPGNPLVLVSGGGSVDITLLAGSSIGDHTLGGGIFAVATVTFDASVGVSPTFFAGFIGVTSTMIDAAGRVTYDDTLVAPPLATTIVQGAIDALKSTRSLQASYDGGNTILLGGALPVQITNPAVSATPALTVVQNTAGQYAIDATGDVHVSGKLTVDGAIDPTSLTLEDAGGSAAYVQSGQGTSAVVAPANKGRIRYNASAAQQWEGSVNTGPWLPFLTGGSGNTGGVAYGEMYISDNVTAVALTLQNTFYKITPNWTAGNADGMTADTANSQIVCNKKSVFFVSVSITSGLDTPNETIEFGIFKNGAHVVKLDQEVEFHQANDVNNASLTGMIALDVGDVIDVRANCTTSAGTNLKPIDVNMSALRIG